MSNASSSGSIIKLSDHVCTRERYNMLHGEPKPAIVTVPRLSLREILELAISAGFMNTGVKITDKDWMKGVGYAWGEYQELMKPYTKMTPKELHAVIVHDINRYNAWDREIKEEDKGVIGRPRKKGAIKRGKKTAISGTPDQSTQEGGECMNEKLTEEVTEEVEEGTQSEPTAEATVATEPTAEPQPEPAPESTQQ